MMSFQISVSPRRRAAAKFITTVRRRIQKAFADAPDITQSAIANELGVHRAVINRQLRGQKDMTLGRVAELAWALGYEPEFDLLRPEVPDGCNAPLLVVGNPFGSTTSASTAFGIEMNRPKQIELSNEPA